MTLKTPITDDDIEDYISGRLDDDRHRAVEAYLQADPARRAEVQALMDHQAALRQIGADLLDEPIPDRFLQLLEDDGTGEDAPEADDQEANGRA